MKSSIATVDSPLLRMVQSTQTDFWNDSCAVAELAYAVERGGTGATSNPVIVVDEIDKASGDSQYDPLGSLYTLLEHDTACDFIDEFAEVGEAEIIAILAGIFDNGAEGEIDRLRRWDAAAFVDFDAVNGLGEFKLCHGSVTRL